MPTPMTIFAKEYDKLTSEMTNAIKAGLENGLTVPKAIDRALKLTKYKERVEAMTLDVMAATVTKNGVDIIASRGLRRWWLNQHWEGQKLTLSQIINSNEVRNQIVATVSGQLKRGSAWTKTAKSITDKQLVGGELSKGMTDLIRFARRSDQRQLISELKKAQRNVDKLAQSGAPTTRLKKAYQNIINVVQEGRVDSLDKAVTRAVNAKARYNAERIARTEMSRANSKATEKRMDDDNDVVGYKSNLSSRHVIDDICDVHAGVDQYGMGDGVAPKNVGLAIPYHPHCLCFSTLVFRSDVKNPKFNPKAGADYLKENPDVRKGVFGKREEIEFKRNPDKWQNIARNYKKPYKRKPDQSIPDDFVNVKK